MILQDERVQKAIENYLETRKSFLMLDRKKPDFDGCMKAGEEQNQAGYEILNAIRNAAGIE